MKASCFYLNVTLLSCRRLTLGSYFLALVLAFVDSVKENGSFKIMLMNTYKVTSNLSLRFQVHLVYCFLLSGDKMFMFVQYISLPLSHKAFIFMVYIYIYNENVMSVLSHNSADLCSEASLSHKYGCNFPGCGCSTRPCGVSLALWRLEISQNHLKDRHQNIRQTWQV